MWWLIVKVFKALFWLERAYVIAEDPGLGPDARQKIWISIGMTVAGITLINCAAWWVLDGQQGWEFVATVFGAMYHQLSYVICRAMLESDNVQL